MMMSAVAVARSCSHMLKRSGKAVEVVYPYRRSTERISPTCPCSSDPLMHMRRCGMFTAAFNSVGDASQRDIIKARRW